MAEVIPFPCGNSEQRKMLAEQNKRVRYEAALEAFRPKRVDQWQWDTWTPRKDK